MALSRPPNSSGRIAISRTTSRRVRFTNLGDLAGPFTSDTTSYSDFDEKVDIKSAYVKGHVITLPGGKTFRRATNYSREYWEYGTARASESKGVWNNRRRLITDDGTDGALFRTPVLIGKTIPKDAENEAVTKALNKIADQKANLGENLGTLGQTVRLFSGKASAAAALANAIENKGFRKWAFKSYRDLINEGIPERIARHYLEYIYGFKPLMQDMYGLHEFSKQSSDKTMLLSGHASASRSVHVGKGPVVNGSRSQVYRVNHSSNAKIKTHLWARIDPQWGGLRAWNQLGLFNPAALAWELTPWSFVVDWLIPIGPVLNALTARAGLIFVDGSTSVRSNETGTYYYMTDFTGSGPKYLKDSTPMLLPFSHEAYGRKAYGNWPLPGLWVDPDPLRGNRSFAAAALALLALRDKKSSFSRSGR